MYLVFIAISWMFVPEKNSSKRRSQSLTSLRSPGWIAVVLLFNKYIRFSRKSVHVLFYIKADEIIGQEVINFPLITLQRQGVFNGKY